MMFRNKIDWSLSIDMNEVQVLARITFFAGALISSSSVFADRPLTGAAALSLMAGRDFKFKCADGLHGFGQFDRRGFAWAAYKSSLSGYDAPEQRATAAVRAQGKELCFTLNGLEIAGEICVPITEKASGAYRLGTQDEWCDINVK